MYILYKITNLINNKYYLGVHKQKKNFLPDKFDGYMGSSRIVNNAIKKHGTEFFKRETLYFSENKEEMYKLEKEMVNISDPLCYNIKEGGVGGFDYINKNEIRPDYILLTEKRKETLLQKYGVDNPGKLECSRNKLIERNKKPKSKSTTQKQSATLILSGKVKGANNGMFGKSGELAPCFGRTGNLHPMFDKHHSEETIIKIKSNENLKKPKEKVMCPYCNKIGGKPVMTHFHFNNCKFKN